MIRGNRPGLTGFSPRTGELPTAATDSFIRSRAKKEPPGSGPGGSEENARSADYFLPRCAVWQAMHEVPIAPAAFFAASSSFFATASDSALVLAAYFPDRSSHDLASPFGGVAFGNSAPLAASSLAGASASSSFLAFR